MDRENQRPERSAKDCALSRYSGQLEESGGSLGKRWGRRCRANAPGTLTPCQRWLAKESHSHSPIHIATQSTDLTGDLRRALSEAKWERKPSRKAA